LKFLWPLFFQAFDFLWSVNIRAYCTIPTTLKSKSEGASINKVGNFSFPRPSPFVTFFLYVILLKIYCCYRFNLRGFFKFILQSNHLIFFFSIEKSQSPMKSVQSLAIYVNEESISSTFYVLRAAFRCAGPKSAKIQSSC